MGRGALWRENQQSTFAHIHTSSSHSTTSPWSPIPYPHCVSTPSFEGTSQVFITLIYNWSVSNRILSVHCTPHRNMFVLWPPDTGHRL